MKFSKVKSYRPLGRDFSSIFGSLPSDFSPSSGGAAT